MNAYHEMWQAVDVNVPEYGPQPEDTTAILDAALNVLRKHIQLNFGHYPDACRVILELLDPDEDGAQ